MFSFQKSSYHSTSSVSSSVQRFEQRFTRSGSSGAGRKYQSSGLQKNNSEVVRHRGYKPSDRYDPRTRDYLTNLTRRVFHTDENRSKKIDLQKLFTPSTDFEEIRPGKNRKLYASSAFYAPGLHPTVEDQVELARRISHSLSDISNKRSKGQTMYINRKKRSVKWVVDGDEEPSQQTYNFQSTKKIENGNEEKSEQTEISSSGPKKLSLKLVMNPQGHVRDFSEVERADTVPNIPIMSPEPIITALNAHKEKGAELFAKRRKKSDKWVIDESNSEQSNTKSNLKSSKQQQSAPAPAPVDNTAIDSISKSINDMKPISSTPDVKPGTTAATPTNYISTTKLAQSPTIIPYNGFGGLAYRPRVAQGWNAPPIKLQVGAPVQPIAPPPMEPPKPSYKLNLDVKREVFANVSPLPYHQNPAPLSPGIVIPEPEPPKPDYSYHAFMTNPPPPEVDIPEPPARLDLPSLANYNTAPRGWGVAKDYYRPVHLDKKFDTMTYSDF